MASTRLTKAIKEELTKDLLLHAFKDRSQKFLAREIELAQDIYDYYMDNTEVLNSKNNRISMRKAISTLPLHWRETESQFQIRFNGSHITINRYEGIQESYQQNHEYIGVTFTPHSDRKRWEFSPKHTYHATLLDLREGEMFDKIEDVFDDKNTLFSELRTAKKSIQAALNVPTTVQKLIIGWPEVEAFASKYITEQGAAKAGLPALPIEMLNQQIGLPPSAVVS